MKTNSTICREAKDSAALTSSQVSQVPGPPLPDHQPKPNYPVSVTTTPFLNLCDQLRKISKVNESGRAPPFSQLRSLGNTGNQDLPTYYRNSQFQLGSVLSHSTCSTSLTVFVELLVLKNTTSHTQKWLCAQECDYNRLSIVIQDPVQKKV